MERVPNHLMELYCSMLRIRLFEERVAELYPEKQMKTPVHLCLGQEAVAAGVCSHLAREDYLFGTHRSHGHCIAKGMALETIAAELYGKETGCCGGRGGSMHLADPERGIPGTSAIVGGSIPLAVGAALSARMQGNGRIAVAFFGDGASEEGVFHESLNFAALHRLPVLFVCENNFYATNSPLSARQSAAGIAAKGAGYGVAAHVVDGNDALAVYNVAGEAAERARSGGGPTLLECRTWRWRGHVGPECDVEKGNRPRHAHRQWLALCPLELHRQRLRTAGTISPEMVAAAERDVAAEVAAAFDSIRNDPDPDIDHILRYVDGRG